MSFIDTTYSTTSGWGNRFPGDANSGTENPKTNPEKVQRIAYLENKVYQLRDMVKNASYTVDQAVNKVDSLKNELSQTKNDAYNYREKSLKYGREKAGLEGKIAGNKQRIYELEQRLPHANDTWTINEIKNEISQRQDARWTLSSELSNVTSAYYSATESMHSADNKVRDLEYQLGQAQNNVYTVREDMRLRKEQLQQHESELSQLKNGW